jgi:hypothetical protein
LNLTQFQSTTTVKVKMSSLLGKCTMVSKQTKHSGLILMVWKCKRGTLSTLIIHWFTLKLVRRCQNLVNLCRCSLVKF